MRCLMTAGKVGKLGGKFLAVPGSVRRWELANSQARDVPRLAADPCWLAGRPSVAGCCRLAEGVPAEDPCRLAGQVKVPVKILGPIAQDAQAKRLYDEIGFGTVTACKRDHMPETFFEPADRYEGRDVVHVVRVADREGCVNGTDGQKDVDSGVGPVGVRNDELIEDAFEPADAFEPIAEYEEVAPLVVHAVS